MPKRPAKAITATAHKLARIIYSMLLNKTPYIEKDVNFYEEQYRQRRVDGLKRNAKNLGFLLVPIPNVDDQGVVAEDEGDSPAALPTPGSRPGLPYAAQGAPERNYVPFTCPSARGIERLATREL